MIKINNITLLEWSLRSLPIFSSDTIIIITQQKHNIKERLYQKISDLYCFNKIHWIELDGLTRGQLDTAYSSKPYVTPKGGIAIFNCDTYFQSRTLFNAMNDPDIDGVIPCYQADGTCWSFCKEINGAITEVREKERISEWASVGLYFFKDSNLFFETADKALSISPDASEYYVAPLYQEYINKGYNIILDKVSFFKPMGSPDQIEKFWNINIKNLIQVNQRPVLVVDLDNTITINNSLDSYSDKRPNIPLIAKLKEFKLAGWDIIIYTSRRMETCENDESKVLANIGQITLEWLNKYGVPYDGIKFGKPYARNGFYVDDKAITPEKFLDMAP